MLHPAQFNARQSLIAHTTSLKIAAGFYRATLKNLNDRQDAASLLPK
jgi:hypothetical protein